MPKSRHRAHASGCARDAYNVLSIQRMSLWLMIGEPIAAIVGMLRITVPTTKDSGAIVLKGTLTGLWARVLLCMARLENLGPGKTFDLKDVIYVDLAGERTLRLLGKVYGASFIAESTYGKHICKKLKLRRVSVAEGENGNAQAGDRSATPIRFKTADTNKNDSLTAQLRSSIPHDAKTEASNAA